MTAWLASGKTEIIHKWSLWQQTKQLPSEGQAGFSSIWNLFVLYIITFFLRRVPLLLQHTELSKLLNFLCLLRVAEEQTRCVRHSGLVFNWSTHATSTQTPKRRRNAARTHSCSYYSFITHLFSFPSQINEHSMSSPLFVLIRHFTAGFSALGSDLHQFRCRLWWSRFTFVWLKSAWSWLTRVNAENLTACV